MQRLYWGAPNVYASISGCGHYEVVITRTIQRGNEGEIRHIARQLATCVHSQRTKKVVVNECKYAD